MKSLSRKEPAFNIGTFLLEGNCLLKIHNLGYRCSIFLWKIHNIYVNLIIEITICNYKSIRIILRNSVYDLYNIQKQIICKN